MNKVTPITYKAKGSPFKISEALVEGAGKVYGSMNKVKGEKQKPSPGNNQQPSTPPPPDLTNQESKDKGETKGDTKVKEENKIVEDYKPDDVVGFFNNIFKNSKS